MRVSIKPSRACGTVTAPPSKSMAHRLLISAGLSEGISTIRNVTDCDDALATLDCLRALGVFCEVHGRDVTVHGVGAKKLHPVAPLSCRESGSTMRFFIPIALSLGTPTTLCGAKRLLERPMDIYEDICKKNGFAFQKSNDSLTVCGVLKSGEFEVLANVSSQFISGLLFILPTLKGDSRIRLIGRCESLSYITLTLSALKEFGVTAYFEDEATIFIPGGQSYLAHDTAVEGDYSGAVFTDALNLLGGSVSVLGLNEESAQGDRAYREHFKSLSGGAPTIDITDCPDLAPMLFALAAELGGAKFVGTDRLKIKESDRAECMRLELSKLGAEVIAGDNCVSIKRSALHAPSEVILGYNDHRIVMAMAILLTRYGGEIVGAEAVAKSYPAFFSDIRALGIEVTEYEA